MSDLASLPRRLPSLLLQVPALPTSGWRLRGVWRNGTGTDVKVLDWGTKP